MKKFITSIAVISSAIIFAQETPKKDSIKTKNIETVTMTKKVFQKKADRLIYDVANSPIAKGSTAFELIKETPLVSSTDDKSLKISGKSNAVIYINGRKSMMNADALEAFLKNTPAENIAKIEVITLPGSEYNVQSSDGIINIVLKKKQTDGTNGNLRMENTQAKNNSQSASASLNFRKGKFGASTNVNYSDYTNLQEYILANGNASTSNTSSGTVKNEDRNFGGYLNLDYALTEKQNLGLSYNFWQSKTPEATTNLFNITKSIGAQNSYSRTQNYMTGDDFNNSVNLNYELKFDDKGSKINLNTAYLNFKKSQFNTSITNFVTAENDIVKLASKFNQNTPQNIDNYSSTLDFVKIFKGFTLGAGGNFNKTKTDNNTYFENYDIATQTFVKDTNQSNHFVYDEKISGIYLNLEKNFSDKFSGKIGARMEFTNSDGEVLGTTTSVKRNESNFLPTLSMNYNINKNNSLSYAFTSRMMRPSFWEINPVRIYLTELNYVQNNPFMKSASVYNQELMYMYKNAYFLQIQNTYIDNATTQVPLQKTVKVQATDESGNLEFDGLGNPILKDVNTIRYIRTNYGSENDLNINLGMNKSFFKQIWTANYVVGFQRKTYKGSVDTDPITNEKFPAFVFDNSMNTVFLQTNNTIRLSSKKDWYLTANYFYMTKQRVDLGTLKPIGSLDLGIKKIWNDWTFNLQTFDVLKTMKIVIDDQQSNGNFNYINQYQFSRRLSLSITYNFGNQKVQKTRDIEGAANDIKNRTGK